MLVSGISFIFAVGNKNKYEYENETLFSDRREANDGQ